MSRAHEKYLSSTAALFAEVPAQGPLVQCLTNTVTTNLVANAVLAVGGSPAMVDIPGESGPMAAGAGAVLINLGTPPTEQRQAMLEAAESASSAGTAWVLDPIGVGTLPVRSELAFRLLDLRPTVIRGNASEIRALAGAGGGARGTDATEDVDDARSAAMQIARDSGAVVAVSGPVDLVTDGDTVVRIDNGTGLFTRITGAGCALGGVIAAFAAVGQDRLQATVAACLGYALAGELAAEVKPRPSSFATEFVDTLSELTTLPLKERARLA
jgi:hydroxyethylthiazole kinase